MIPKELEDTLRLIHGTKASSWISALPKSIKNLENQWNIRNVIPLESLSFNYVARALDAGGAPVVLKLILDEQSYYREKLSLQKLKGYRIVRVIDSSDEHQALLLEKLQPGETLKESTSLTLDAKMHIYANLLNQQDPIIEPQTENFPTILDWFQAFHGPYAVELPKNVLKKALEFQKKSAKDPLHFCHGDLHLENILSHGKSWTMIDPKGVLATKAFEVAAFDFLSEEELLNDSPMADLLEERICLLAQHCHLEIQTLKETLFLKLTLSALWFMDDNLCPLKPLRILEALQKIV